MIIKGLTQPEINSIKLESTLTQYLNDIDKVSLIDTLKEGFVFNDMRFQSDSIAQQNATGYISALSAGLTIPFPIVWRRKDNINYDIPDIDTFKAFSTRMLVFVQACYNTVWGIKDEMRASITIDELNLAYQSGIDALALLNMQ